MVMEEAWLSVYWQDIYGEREPGKGEDGGLLACWDVEYSLNILNFV